VARTGDIDRKVIPNGINQIESGFMCDNPDSIENLMLGAIVHPTVVAKNDLTVGS
jgi:hypothetical protein